MCASLVYFEVLYLLVRVMFRKGEEKNKRKKNKSKQSEKEDQSPKKKIHFFFCVKVFLFG